jgi:hypothetical protein
MFKNTLKLVCTVGGAVLVTLALPELMAYAAPIDVIVYTGGLAISAMGIVSILRG